MHIHGTGRKKHHRFVSCNMIFCDNHVLRRTCSYLLQHNTDNYNIINFILHNV